MDSLGGAENREPSTGRNPVIGRELLVLVVLLAAGVCFLASAFNVQSRVNLVSLGLALCTLAALVLLGLAPIVRR